MRKMWATVGQRGAACGGRGRLGSQRRRVEGGKARLGEPRPHGGSHRQEAAVFEFAGAAEGDEGVEEFFERRLQTLARSVVTARVVGSRLPVCVELIALVEQTGKEVTLFHAERLPPRRGHVESAGWRRPLAALHNSL